jgi:hypothetical protein
MCRHHRRFARACGAALLFHLAACASFAPRPMDEIPFKERAQTQSRGGLTVTTSVLTADEAEQAFGIALADDQIQPVWFTIRNDSDLPYSFLKSAVDPNYYSAHEVAYINHVRFDDDFNRRIDDHFGAHAFDTALPPHSERSGFVFTHLKLGTKEVRVRLYSPQRVEEFVFFVEVPGFQADHHQVDWDALMAQEFIDYDDELALHDALQDLPCCTTRADGSGEGDPLNIILIGSRDDVGDALLHAGWYETETLTAGSATRTAAAALGGGEYKYSPMSSLYVYGRPQDAGFQKARDTIHERNHLRLWLSPMTFRGEHVWVGTITRDIGVYFTTRAWNLTTHAIDPYVDEARDHLAENLAHGRSLRRFGLVGGVGSASRDEPHRNLMNAPWYTDGLRLVMEISRDPVALDEISMFDWSEDPLFAP